MIAYRPASQDDLANIIHFVDYWLAGRGRKDKAPGVSNDYFVSAKQHFDYQKNDKIILALENSKIIGWAVKNKHHVLIHLLVSGYHRNQGIGKELIRQINPEMIRSKMDQSTGNPAQFYENIGFQKIEGPPIGKNQNIELYIRSTQNFKQKNK